MSEAAVVDMIPIDSTPTSLESPPERRRSARIPLAGPIRVGPPHREAHARLSATDLSTGGMFIDADRPVRVGARFCAEIVLSDGHHLYIPEAEVAYNRERPHGSGFGVRFLEVPSEAQRRLEDEVMRQSLDADGLSSVDLEIPSPTLSVPPLVSEAPTAAETPKATVPIPSEGPSARPRPRRDLRQRLRGELRAMVAQLPSLWLVLAGLGGAMLLVAIGLVTWAEISSAPRIDVAPLAPREEGLSAETHARLMGRPEPEPLPPLEPLEAAEAPRPPVTGERTPRERAPKPEADAPAPAARALLPPGAAVVGTVTLPEGTTVRRTSRLRKPDRFVVDVTGLQLEPKSNDLDTSRIERVRFGRHDGFGRLVFDLTPSAGRLTHRLDGTSLRVVELD